MKNYLQLFTPPTGEKRKDNRGFKRLLMLLLMCLVTGVGMAQIETSVEFDCGVTASKDRWKEKKIENITLIYPNTAGNNNYNTVNLGEVINIKSLQYNISKVELTYAKGTSTILNISSKDTYFETTLFNDKEVNIKALQNDIRVLKVIVYVLKNVTNVAPTFNEGFPKVSSSSVTVGEAFKLSAEATGTPAPTYKWYKNSTDSKVNGTPVGELTKETSLETKEDVAGTYYYYCVASNGVEPNATSNTIAVTVNKKNLVLAAPAMTFTVGDAAQAIAVTAKDGETSVEGLAYTYVSGNTGVVTVDDNGNVTPVAAGETTVTIKLADNDKYVAEDITVPVTVKEQVVTTESSVEFGCGNTTEGTLKKGVKELQKDDIIVVFNNDLENNGANSIKTTNNTLTIKSTTKKIVKVEILGGSGSDKYKEKTFSFEKVNDTGSFSAARILTCTSWSTGEVVISITGNDKSYISKITVYYEDGTPAAPVFTEQPESTPAILHEEFTLTAKASGNPAPTYQWYSNTSNSTENGTLIDGATSDTYTTSLDKAGDYYYYCVASNGVGTDATSNVATVTVGKKKLTLVGNELNLVKNTAATPLNIVAVYGENVIEGLTYTYSSNKEDVATVNANGEVTPVAVGTATITVAFAGNDTYEAAEIKIAVNVTAGVMKPEITVTSDAEGKTVVTNYTEENPYDGDNLYIWLSLPADLKDNTNYEIRYSIDNSNLGSTWSGTSKMITQTTYVYARIYNKSTKKFEGDVLEVPIRFNFTLISAFKNSDDFRGDNIKPGFQRNITTSDGSKTYVVATFGSKDDTSKGSDGKGVWLNVSKDETMGNSEISGYNYVVRGNVDAKAEDGVQFDGNGMEDAKVEDGSGYYMEESTDNGTFKIPVSGAYVMFEPKMGGTINVILRQNGIIANLEQPKYEVMRMRPIYVCDETGHVLDDVKAMINSNSVMNANIFKFGVAKKFTEDTGANPQTVAQSNANLKLYQQLVYNAGHEGYTLTRSEDGMSATLTDAAGKEVPDDELSAYWKGNAKTDVTKNILHKYGKGWITLSKAYVRYSFDVEPGKTYFIMGHVTKIGACGYSFKRRVRNDEDWNTVMKGRKITIDETEINKLPGAVEKDAETGISGVDVTLNRTFHKGVWTTLVLPFSVSPYTLAKTFGEGTEVLHFGEVEGSKLNLVKHHHQMIVAGTPVLIKPAGTFEAEGTKKWLFENVSYNPATPIKEMTGGDWKITGSYTATTIPANSYYVGYKADGLGNNVYLSKNGRDMNGTRAWFEYMGSDMPAKLTGFSINGVEDGNVTTDIDDIFNDDDKPSAFNNNVYNLNGQLVSSNGLEGLEKGIYIVKGKKIIVK